MAATVGYSAFTKSTTGITDNTATDVLSVSVPNVTLAASLLVTLTGSLGAGGAVGAYEATGTVAYRISIAKRAGAAAVVTASSAFGSAMANVAGAATITVTAAASAIAGGTGANTFTVKATIAKGSGSSAAHVCSVHAELVDASGGGVKIS